MFSITQEAAALEDAGLPVQSFTFGRNAEELGWSGNRALIRIDREHAIAQVGDVVRLERPGYAVKTVYMGCVVKAELAGKTHDVILTVAVEA